MKKITLYTTRYCGFCHQAKSLLESKNLSFEDIDVTDNPTLRETIKQKHQWPTVPIILIDDQMIGGCQDLMNLDKEGKL